jgi:hypothetical protein
MQKLMYQLRWIVSDTLIFWSMRIAPKGEEKDDLMVTLHPWLQRQVARARAEIERMRP